MDAIRQLFLNRSIRLQSQVGKPGNLVRFSSNAYVDEGQPQEIAQYADVSSTGMRLVSRQTANWNVGDLILVEFTIPGEQMTVKNQARVVRRLNDFVFAVHFHNMPKLLSHTLELAIERELNRDRWSFATSPLRSFANWLSDHQKGLCISLVGVIFIGGIGVNIYLNSDEHLGKKMRSWGRAFPKEWHLDYIRGFNLPKKDPPSR